MVAAAIIGGAVVGAAGSAYAGKKAGDAAENAANTASRDTMEQYYQNREDLAPWREAGMGALDQLKTGTAAGGDFNRDFTLADFQKDPGYQFRMDEGTRALEASAAARGGILNGRTLKELARYGQDYASGEYTNAYNRFNADRNARFNRLSSLAGTAQTTANILANMGTNAVNATNEAGYQAANARGSGYVANANALNQGIGTLSNFYMQQQQPQQQWYNSSGGSSTTRGPVSDSVTLSDGTQFFG